MILISFMPNMDENDNRVVYDQMINSPTDGVLAVLILVNGHRRGVQGNPIFRWMRRHFAKRFRMLVPQPLEFSPTIWFEESSGAKGGES